MTESGKDKILLEKVAKCEEAAFRELYLKWQPQLSSFIYRLTKSHELSAEIVQDVFLKIWMSREALPGIENFKSYLFVIAKNQAINAFRKVLTDLRRFEYMEDLSKVEGEIQRPESDNPHLSIIDEAIDKLPPRQKEVYLLHRHQKLTYQEVADHLGIGKESVKTHIGLAVKFIKRYTEAHLTLLTIVVEKISEKFNFF